MKNKKKLHIVVVLPVIAVLVIGMLLSYVLIAATSRHTAVAANEAPVQVASADAGVAVSSPVAGEPGVSEGSEGSGEMVANPGADDAAPPAMEQPACDFSAWIGKPVDQQALDATKRPVRVMKPGDAATMDYSPSRINVITDPASGNVTDVHCG